jgi:uncharacterized membrane protein YqjE
MQPQGNVERTGGESPSLGDLLRQLANDSATLVREEFALARQEVKEALAALGTSVTLVAAGAVLALLALGTLVASAVIGLGHEVGYGTSALVIGLVITAIAGIAMAWGVKRLRASSLKPEKTIESIREGKEWMKDLT